MYWNRYKESLHCLPQPC